MVAFGENHASWSHYHWYQILRRLPSLGEKSITESEPGLSIYGWDRNLDFDTEKYKLESRIQETKYNRSLRAFYCIFLVQLVNGAMIGESVAAALQWSDNGKIEQRVQVEKRKDKYIRLIIIPVTVRQQKGMRTEFEKLRTQYVNLANTACRIAKERLGYNSHALRYAFINGMAKKLPPQQIAKLTGHKNLNMILHYTQTREAEQRLREIISWNVAGNNANI